MPVKRIFVAIDLSEDVRSLVADYISLFRDRFCNVPVKWERPEKLHLTIKFIGSVDEDGLKDIRGQVEKAASYMQPFKIRINGTGVFEKGERAVLWIAVEAVDVAKYQNPIQRIAVLLGLDGVSKRRFKPHLTIARLKNSKNAADLINEHRGQSLDAGNFEVNSLTIYESKLLPSGSVYSVISKVPFTG